MDFAKRTRVAEEWSLRLGLALTELLPARGAEPCEHYALMDGVDGSFVLSTGVVDAGIALDWTWSSRFPVHVSIGKDSVLARQTHPAAPVLKFRTEQVEDNTERFFDTLNARLLNPLSSVEDHIVQCFRAHRHVAAKHNLTEEQALESFLKVLDEIVGKRPASFDSRLPQSHQEQLRETLGYNELVRRKTDLALTMRHAAGMVFQETYAELSAEPAIEDMFGMAPAPDLPTRNRAGVYYTPPGLARAMTDMALPRYLDRPAIRIADPACGSGAFLGEAARSLQRQGYKGRVELVGFDLSAAAIKMANFALKHNDAVDNDNLRLEARNFLTLKESLDADVIVMNPPFVPAPVWEPRLREQAREILGNVYANRPDLSMVFTACALRHLKPNGTLATLVPAGVLAQQGGRSWRASIAEAQTIDLIAVLGDHGLFRDAVVSVAALVLRNVSDAFRKPPVELWTSGRRGASSAALRRLRRWSTGDQRTERTENWSIRREPTGSAIEREDWTPRPALLGDLPQRLRLRRHIVCVKDRFSVELGIRGGKLKDILQLTWTELARLPPKERKLFRPVAETRSIQHGRINPRKWAFYPDEPMTYSDISRAAKTFFTEVVTHLRVGEDDIVDFYRAVRKTNVRGEPRIVSKAYIGTYSFACDEQGEYVVTQGHAWRPCAPVTEAPFDLGELLCDYAFILNSWPFFLLAREYGRIVAGGQVEGAKKYMGEIPFPCLPTLYMESPEMRERAKELREQAHETYPDIHELNAFAASAYFTNLNEWPIPR